MEKVFGHLSKKTMDMIVNGKENDNLDKMALFAELRFPVQQLHSKMLCVYLSYLMINHENTFAKSKLFVNCFAVNKNGVQGYSLDLSEATREDLIALYVYKKFIDNLTCPRK